MPTSKSLVWDEDSQKYIRRIGPRKPLKGIIGVKPRKRSFQDDMNPLKLHCRHINSLSGAEKRRKRKGGNPNGGPGGGGIQGSMKRLKASLNQNDPREIIDKRGRAA